MLVRIGRSASLVGMVLAACAGAPASAQDATTCTAMRAITVPGTALEITASDNGVGFNPSANDSEASSAGHDGLRNMDKRLTDVGGCCRVTSTPGQGTTIRLIVPVSSLNVHREK